VESDALALLRLQAGRLAAVTSDFKKAILGFFKQANDHFLLILQEQSFIFLFESIELF
jgi:hypothetical protein